MKGERRSAAAIRFPEELHERLRAASESHGLSVNYLVVKAVEELLDNLIPADELRLTRQPPSPYVPPLTPSYPTTPNTPGFPYWDRQIWCGATTESADAMPTTNTADVDRG